MYHISFDKYDIFRYMTDRRLNPKGDWSAVWAKEETDNIDIQEIDDSVTAIVDVHHMINLHCGYVHNTRPQ